MSDTVRIPTDTHDDIKRIAALQGRTPGELITEAWNQYLDMHRAEFASDFEKAAEAIRTGDTAALAQFASRSAIDRAAAAAKAARE